MGISFPAAVGFALAKKLKKEEGKVYCVMSDGESAIGTTWEAMLIAAHHKLDNLVVIVDRNGFQAMGKIDDILMVDTKDFFGWDEVFVNGHDFDDLERNIFGFANEYGKPTLLHCRTIKGKGWKRAENNNLYHYKNLSDEEYQEALKELNA